MSSYKDIDIRIRRDEVSFSLNGQSILIKPDFREEKLLQLINPPVLGNSREYGWDLLQCTFQDHLEDIKGVLDSKQKLRLRLDIDSNDEMLDAIWWECLCFEGKLSQNFGRSDHTLVSRYQGANGYAYQPAEVSKIRILTVVSDPVDPDNDRWQNLRRLDKAKQLELLQTVKTHFDKAEIIEFELFDGPADFELISEKLADGGFNALHFVGHTYFWENQGYLLFENEDDGTVEHIHEEEIGKRLKALTDFRLLILSGDGTPEDDGSEGFLKIAAHLMTYGVPAVVTFESLGAFDSDLQYVKWFRLFYINMFDSLVNSSSPEVLIDKAVNYARRTVYTRMFGEPDYVWAAPVLFVHGEGKLFRLLSKGGRRGNTNRSVSEERPGARAVHVMGQSESVQDHAEKIRVYCSYSREDTSLRNELQQHLSTLLRIGVIEMWHDRLILPGDKSSDIIEEKLEASDIILLLISSDFIASDYCYEIELERALDLHEEAKTCVVPIIVRPCDWRIDKFSLLKALPESMQAVTSSHWNNKDEAWDHVAKGIRKLIEHKFSHRKVTDILQRQIDIRTRIQLKPAHLNIELKDQASGPLSISGTSAATFLRTSSVSDKMNWQADRRANAYRDLGKKL